MKENRVLTIDNLTTTFESHKQKIQAVRGVSLHVDEGDILAIVGESGSGKSVTMKSVMGLSEKMQMCRQIIWNCCRRICCPCLKKKNGKCVEKIWQ